MANSATDHTQNHRVSFEYNGKVITGRRARSIIWGSLLIFIVFEGIIVFSFVTLSGHFIPNQVETETYATSFPDTILVANDPESRYISWTAEYPASHHIADVLKGTSGWEIAGIEFSFVQKPSEADIVFELYPAEKLHRLCESIAAGCAGIRVLPMSSELPFQCHVLLDEMYFGYENLWFVPHLINHEVGHCFGLKHSDNPDHLMLPGGLIKWPSFYEIIAVYNILPPDGTEQ